MIAELNNPDMPGNADQPATKRDIYRLDQKIDNQYSSLRSEIQTMKQEILDHFDAVIENVEDELKGANRDEIELIKNVQQRHEQRIAQLETAAP